MKNIAKPAKLAKTRVNQISKNRVLAALATLANKKTRVHCQAILSPFYPTDRFIVRRYHRRFIPRAVSLSGDTIADFIRRRQLLIGEEV